MVARFFPFKSFFTPIFVSCRPCFPGGASNRPPMLNPA